MYNSLETKTGLDVKTSAIGGISTLGEEEVSELETRTTYLRGLTRGLGISGLGGISLTLPSEIAIRLSFDYVFLSSAIDLYWKYQLLGSSVGS